MAVPAPDEFWQSLVTVRLFDAETAGRLRAECPAMGVGVAKAAIEWLVDRGMLTRWKAKRLAAGDRGPFVVGEYRLLERHDRDGDSRLFTSRHEPSGRLVTLVLLNPKRCRDAEAWAALVKRVEAAIAASDPMLTSQRTARLCAAILDRRDTVPAPPFSTAVNTSIGLRDRAARGTP